MPKTVQPESVTVKVAGEMVGLSSYRIGQLCDGGQIASGFDGPRRLVNVESLRAYIASLPAARPVEVSA